MGVAERKGRERAEREKRIVATAREIAARDGWPAVTIRRLAEEIEYSQPVLYSHFANREAIVAAVAVEGFAELAAALWHAGEPPVRGREAIHSVAAAYLAFARAYPALYEAMFTMPTGLHFGNDDTRQELRDAFAALAAVVTPLRSDGEAQTLTETYWATLHGLAELERSARLRPTACADRLTVVVDALFLVSRP